MARKTGKRRSDHDDALHHHLHVPSSWFQDPPRRVQKGLAPQQHKSTPPGKLPDRCPKVESPPRLRWRVALSTCDEFVKGSREAVHTDE